MINIRTTYSIQAEKFLKRNPSRLSIEKCETLINSAVKKLTGVEQNNTDIKKMEGKYKGKYRIRSGEMRIVFSIEFGIIHIVSVEEINFRGSSY